MKTERSSERGRRRARYLGNVRFEVLLCDRIVKAGILYLRESHWKKERTFLLRDLRSRSAQSSSDREGTPLLKRGCCESHEEASVSAVYDRAFFLESTKCARS